MDSGPEVEGFCPMGCGETLELHSGTVVCAAKHCPDRLRLASIIQDSETEHIAEFAEGHFTLKHPLRERTDGLFGCQVHEELLALGAPPRSPGRYRVTWHQADPVSESYRPGDGPFDYEPVE